MGVSSDMRSSRVRRQAAKKPNKERTVQVRFSDEELAALDAICSEKKDDPLRISPQLRGEGTGRGC